MSKKTKELNEIINGLTESNALREAAKTHYHEATQKGKHHSEALQSASRKVVEICKATLAN